MTHSCLSAGENKMTTVHYFLACALICGCLLHIGNGLHIVTYNNVRGYMNWGNPFFADIFKSYMKTCPVQCTISYNKKDVSKHSDVYIYTVYTAYHHIYVVSISRS